MGSPGGAFVGKSITKIPGGLARSVAEFTTEQGTAREYAEEFQRRFNANNETLQRYAEKRFGTDLTRTVVAFTFSDRRGTRAKRYLVAADDEPTDTGSTARIVGPERFDELASSVDHQIKADWYLSHNAADELRTFVEKYAEPDADVPNGYIVKTAMKYGDSVEGDLWENVVASYA